MIAKFSSGNDVGGAIKYDLRLGQEEQQKVTILGALGFTVQRHPDGKIEADPELLIKEFNLHCLLRPSVKNPVHHFSLSWRTGENIPDDEMLARTEEFLEGMGYGNTQYIIIRHQKANQHDHVICNAIDRYGKLIDTFLLVQRAHAVAKAITLKYGYQMGTSARQNQNVHAPHEAARYYIEPIIWHSLINCQSVDDLPRFLKPHGIECRFRDDKDGKHIGISFSVTLKGQQHTFNGSSIDKELSFPKIVKLINGFVHTRASIMEQIKRDNLQEAIDSIPVEETKPVVKPQVVNAKKEEKKERVAPEDGGTAGSPNLVHVPDTPVSPQPSNNPDVQSCVKEIRSVIPTMEQVAKNINRYELSPKREFEKKDPQDDVKRFLKAWDSFREQAGRLKEVQETPVDADVLAEVANAADNMMLHMINLLIAIENDHYRIKNNEESENRYKDFKIRLEEIKKLIEQQEKIVPLIKGLLNERERPNLLKTFTKLHKKAKELLDYPRTVWEPDEYLSCPCQILEFEPGKYRLENFEHGKWERAADSDFKSFTIKPDGNGYYDIRVTDLAGEKHRYNQFGAELPNKNIRQRGKKLSEKNWS